MELIFFDTLQDKFITFTRTRLICILSIHQQNIENIFRHIWDPIYTRDTLLVINLLLKIAQKAWGQEPSICSQILNPKINQNCNFEYNLKKLTILLYLYDFQLTMESNLLPPCMDIDSEDTKNHVNIVTACRQNRAWR